MSSQLLADIGGTRARFALLDGERLGPIESVSTAAYASVDDALHHFLNSQAEGVAVDRAVVAAAGPVSGARCKLTNAPWVLDSQKLCQAFGLSSMTIVNDLEALAWAVPHLDDQDIRPIGDGFATLGKPVAVIAPGTGLGVACYLPGFAAAHVVPSEGGHATLAATNPGDRDIIDVLHNRFGHVSAERVLSGRGLVNLHRALAMRDGCEADDLTAEEIVRGAAEARSRRCIATLDAFCGLLGAFAGDIALTFAARGGVLFAGGMAPHLIPLIEGSAFRSRFADKGRLSDYVSAIPTGVIVRPEPTFLGLVSLALRPSS